MRVFALKAPVSICFRSLFSTLTIALSVASAPAIAQMRVQVVTLATGLDTPWAVAFLPGGRFLVTERDGDMRIVAPDGKVGSTLDSVPDVESSGQGGLLDVVADTDFVRNRQIYFCYAEAGEGGAGTALASARLSTAQDRLEDVKVLFRQQPKVAGGNHFGCRIVEGRDGLLWLTLGDRFAYRDSAQKLDNHLGKIVRIGKDGKVPRDNPFVNRPGALPEIWSYGHRNVQGATLAPDGRLWTHEHGPQGGDEINTPQAGRNYGWPVITYGVNYGGGKIGDGITRKDGMEQPLHYWVPSIAPSGMAFLTSDRYGPAWKGNLFVGALKSQFLDRIVLDGTRVVSEEKLLGDLRERIRDVRQGPDGLLYVLTDGAKGRLLRLDPAGKP